MPERADTVVFIPAWNEEASLPAVLADIDSELGEVDVLVVDDGSTDATAEIARAGGAEVVSFAENRGLPAAIAAGYGYAAEHGYRFCGRVDADGQHPARELRRLLELVRSDACDVAVGSRFAAGNGYAERRYEATPVRSLGHFVLRRLIRARLSRPVLDATSGLSAAGERALPLLRQPYRAAAPEVEGLIRVAEAGLRIEEVPVDMLQRTSGSSKLHGRKALTLVLTVVATLVIGVHLRRRRR